MATSHLLPPRVCVVVHEQTAIHRNIQSELDDLRLELRVVGYGTESAAEDGMRAQTFEAVLMVADFVAVNLLKKVGKSGKQFPFVKTLFYSARATEKNVSQLSNEQQIDAYAARNDKESLRMHLQNLYDDYVNDPSLQSLYHYICNECPDPETPFYPDGEGNLLTVIEVYKQIVRGTLLGQQAVQTWQYLVRREAAEAEVK